MFVHEVCAHPPGKVSLSLMNRLIRSLLLAPLALLACGDSAPEATPATTTVDAAATASHLAAKYASANMDSLGLATYASCASCHQADGSGHQGLISPLAGSEIVLGKPEIPVAIILHGVNGPLTVKGTVYRGLMISWGKSLDDVQVAALTTYIRTAWGNTASPVTPELVARVRAASASRTSTWSWAELERSEF